MPTKTPPKPQVKKKYEFVISKNDKNALIDDVEAWIKLETRGEWSKQNRRSTVLYVFNDLNDAFKFKLRWSPS